MTNKQIYISTDIETDGPIPGEYSMLSFGSAAFIFDFPTKKFELVEVFQRNLELLPNAKQSPDTMNFWAENQAAYDETRINPVNPEVAFKDYVKWLKDIRKTFNGDVVFVGYPAGFDFTFIYWYLIKFAGESPFSFSGIDIKTFAMAVLGTKYRETTKKNFPKEWFSKKHKHTHVALEDAIEQGELFMNILKQNYKQLDILDEHQHMSKYGVSRGSYTG